MSAPKPYDVSAPFLMAEAGPEVDYFHPIQVFAAERIEALAKRVIIRLQRMPAVGMFEDTAEPLKTVWDEWCWYQEKYDSDTGMLSDGFEETLDSMVAGTVSELPHSEAVLISCGVCEDQDHMPARSDDDICAVVRQVVTEAASKRSMDRFEVW
ncbi:hypothetical protein [uncultured Tateyamaria sp.]|uniref:hypothetical protein n=1 Tax=uncultured Tateyamaria sp. TaxID=455651 RepID=UPI00262687BF|nr:hypothetical protein [uncultured Tateyamaria sp.]